MPDPPPPRPPLLCDIDGVVWLGGEGIAGAAGAVARLRAAGFPVAFLTNNSSLTPEVYASRLGAIGIDVDPADVITSAQAAAALLDDPAGAGLPPGSRVLACAGEGVVAALSARGFEVVEAGPCAAVVVGWHRTFDFDRLTRAADAVRAGARFVATNDDDTYPAAGRILPGCGSLVAAVATASGRVATVAGKPYPATVALVRERFGDDGIMVGDRPSTDGALAAALGWPFALVVSAVTVSTGEPHADGAALRSATLAGIADELLGAAD